MQQCLQKWRAQVVPSGGPLLDVRRRRDRVVIGRHSLAVIFAVLAAIAVASPVDARRHNNPVFDQDALAVLRAAESGDWDELNKLLPPCSKLLSSTADTGMTMLQWTLANNNEKAFRLLLRAGAKPDQPGLDGDTVIHDAAGHRNPKWLKLLLENGASPNVGNSANGATPLVRALIAERDEQFEMLLKAGTNPNLADATGNTPLHVAAQINKPWHVYMLLTNRADPADPFLRNAQGQTFQRYLFMTEDGLLNKRTREGRRLVLDYLSIKDIPIEPGAPPHHQPEFKQP